jgi:hypothetical protein
MSSFAQSKNPDSYSFLIHGNPLRARVVEKPKDWLLSSPKDFEGVYGQVDIYFRD